MAINPSTSTLHIVLASNDSRHVSPFFRLATSISHLGHHVSLVSTLSNIKAVTLDPSIAKPTNLDLIPLQADNRTNLKEEFTTFLLQATKDFDWVLYDNSTFWVPDISKELGIHSAYVISASVIASAFLWPAICVPDFSKIHQLMQQEISSPKDHCSHEASMLHDQLMLRDAEDLVLYYRINKAIATCDMVALPSYYELDRAFPQSLEGVCQKKVVCFGHLLPTATNAVDNRLMNSIIIKEWLDKRSRYSVVYVAFEAEICITPQQVYAIAHGLENSCYPFIWVTGNLQGVQTHDELPDGFEERTINRGLVCKHWVPHADILGHPSIGGFLTNGGWSLCAEALNFGIPLILTPFTTAEVRNARLIESKRLGYEIKKDPRHGVILSVEVEHVLELIMADRDGGRIRDCANDKRGFFNILQHSYLMNFLDQLAEMKIKKKKQQQKSVVATTKKKMKNVADTTEEYSYVCKFDGCVICKGKQKVVAIDNNI